MRTPVFYARCCAMSSIAPSEVAMRISNEPGEASGGPWADLLRLQSEFQARLGSEPPRTLRRLQGALGPAAPGTVVVPDPEQELTATGLPGAVLELTLEVENR